MSNDRNCGCGNNFAVQPLPYQPVMPMAPMMPMTYGNQYGTQDFQGMGYQNIEQRINNIEKRLSILESNLNVQSMNSGFNNTNYQII